MSLSGYRILWLQVMFDLPTNTQKERQTASLFRHFLLDMGFDMAQFSVYLRHCANRDIADKYIRKIERQMPEKGKVALLIFTDKQYANMRVFYGKKRQNLSKRNLEYEFF